MTTSRRPAPTLLLLAGRATGGSGLLTELARALGHQIASSAAEPLGNRLGSWFSTGERVALADAQLATHLPRYTEAADRLGVALPVIVVVDHPASESGSEETAFEWLGSVLGAAHASRRRSRSVLRVEDLLDDWQAALSRADKESGSRLMAGATLAQLDDADDVVRGWPPAVPPEWSRLDLPAELRDLCARSYAALCSIADGRGDLDFVDALWAEYAAEFGAAS